MKRTALVLAGLATLFALSGVAADASSDFSASSVRTLTGQYWWTYNDGPGPLRAEFTQRDDESWDVAFYFRFDGRDRIYRGIAEGSLSEGGMAGKVKNENERRTFTFKGKFDDGGKFRGTHAETTPSRARRTGTLVLEEALSSGSR